jgi:hypothetical protein
MAENDELKEFNSPLDPLELTKPLDPLEAARQRLREGLGRPGLPRALFDAPPSWGNISPWDPQEGRQYNVADRRDESPAVSATRNLEQSAYKGIPQFAAPPEGEVERPPHTLLSVQGGSSYLPWRSDPIIPWKEKTNLDYNTPLSPEERGAYKDWAKQGGKNPDLEEKDYDLPGYFKSGGKLGGKDEHLTDQFKKPNHPTFSDQSQYHGTGGEEGGTWTALPDGKFNFTPGRSNMDYWGPQGLQDYFNKYEKGNTLTIPEEY